MNKPNELKLSTEERLLKSAETLFSSFWYETVSIVEICRKAGLSNGCFYRYFKNKEEIFRNLLELFLKKINNDLSEIQGGAVTDRLDEFINIVIDAGIKYRSLVSIFREGQYRFPEYEGALRDIYMSALSKVYERTLNESEYIYITSGLRFLSIRSLYNNLELDRKAVKDIIQSGVFPESESRQEKIFSRKADKLEITSEKTSKTKLIHAGIKLFGRDGYYETSVYDIAREAGFSVGTFYIYFNSKENLISEIVELIGRSTRFYLKKNIDPGLNRLDQELQGMYLFLHIFYLNRNFYEIVREAEFVVNKDVKTYYDKFESGYLKNLKNIKYADSKTAANFLMGTSHYLGIEYLFSENIKTLKKVILDIGQFFSTGISK